MESISISDESIRRQTIAGAALTGLGGTMLITGAVFMVKGAIRTDSEDGGQDHKEDMLSTSIIFAAGGAALITAGAINIGIANKRAGKLQVLLIPDPAISGLKVRLKF